MFLLRQDVIVPIRPLSWLFLLSFGLLPWGLPAQLFEFDNRWETSTFAPTSFQQAQFRAMDSLGYRKLVVLESTAQSDTSNRHDYFLDSLGRLEQVVSQWAALPTSKIHYRYNANGALAQISCLGFREYEVSLEYLANGALNRVIYHNGNLPRSGWTKTWSYRKNGQIKRVIADRGNYQMVYRFKYKKGWLRQVKAEVAGKLVEVYAEDSVLWKANGEKLIIPKPPAAVEWRYRYDERGRMAEVSQYRLGPKTLLKRESLEYDSEGFLELVREYRPKKQDADWKGCDKGNKYHHYTFGSDGLLLTFHTKVCKRDGGTITTIGKGHNYQ